MMLNQPLSENNSDILQETSINTTTPVSNQKSKHCHTMAKASKNDPRTLSNLSSKSLQHQTTTTRGDLKQQTTSSSSSSPATKPLAKNGKVMSKKAYVRFDDYLDLNEENMRRSCKKLMNHLYSDSSLSSSHQTNIIKTTTTTTTTPTSPLEAELGANCKRTGSNGNNSSVAVTLPTKSTKPQQHENCFPLSISCCQSEEARVGDVSVVVGKTFKQQEKGPTTTRGKTISSQNKLVVEATNYSRASTLVAIPNTSAATAAAAASNSKRLLASATATATSASGKSYLRSQYERRQQRQLQIASKKNQNQQQQMAQIMRTLSTNATNIGGPIEGRSEKEDLKEMLRRRVQREQEQQDLVVAKSHELSKKRFFEKLERRESMLSVKKKNLNLGTQSAAITLTAAAGVDDDEDVLGDAISISQNSSNTLLEEKQQLYSMVRHRNRLLAPPVPQSQQHDRLEQQQQQLQLENGLVVEPLTVATTIDGSGKLMQTLQRLDIQEHLKMVKLVEEEEEGGQEQIAVLEVKQKHNGKELANAISETQKCASDEAQMLLRVHQSIIKVGKKDNIDNVADEADICGKKICQLTRDTHGELDRTFAFSHYNNNGPNHGWDRGVKEEFSYLQNVPSSTFVMTKNNQQKQLIGFQSLSSTISNLNAAVDIRGNVCGQQEFYPSSPSKLIDLNSKFNKAEGDVDGEESVSVVNLKNNHSNRLVVAQASSLACCPVSEKDFEIRVPQSAIAAVSPSTFKSNSLSKSQSAEGAVLIKATAAPQKQEHEQQLKTTIPDNNNRQFTRSDGFISSSPSSSSPLSARSLLLVKQVSLEQEQAVVGKELEKESRVEEKFLSQEQLAASGMNTDENFAHHFHECSSSSLGSENVVPCEAGMKIKKSCNKTLVDLADISEINSKKKEERQLISCKEEENSIRRRQGQELFGDEEEKEKTMKHLRLNKCSPPTSSPTSIDNDDHDGSHIIIISDNKIDKVEREAKQSARLTATESSKLPTTGGGKLKSQKQELTISQFEGSKRKGGKYGKEGIGGNNNKNLKTNSSSVSLEEGGGGEQAKDKMEVLARKTTDKGGIGLKKATTSNSLSLNLSKTKEEGKQSDSDCNEKAQTVNKMRFVDVVDKEKSFIVLSNNLTLQNIEESPHEGPETLFVAVEQSASQLSGNKYGAEEEEEEKEASFRHEGSNNNNRRLEKETTTKTTTNLNSFLKKGTNFNFDSNSNLDGKESKAMESRVQFVPVEEDVKSCAAKMKLEIEMEMEKKKQVAVICSNENSTTLVSACRAFGAASALAIEANGASIPSTPAASIPLETKTTTTTTISNEPIEIRDLLPEANGETNQTVKHEEGKHLERTTEQQVVSSSDVGRFTDPTMASRVGAGADATVSAEAEEELKVRLVEKNPTQRQLFDDVNKREKNLQEKLDKDKEKMSSGIEKSITGLVNYANSSILDTRDLESRKNNMDVIDSHGVKANEEKLKRSVKATGGGCGKSFEEEKITLNGFIKSNVVDEIRSSNLMDKIGREEKETLIESFFVFNKNNNNSSKNENHQMKPVAKSNNNNKREESVLARIVACNDNKNNMNNNNTASVIMRSMATSLHDNNNSNNKTPEFFQQEDCGSSCGSSGFGPSGVSVTCSSSSSSSSSSSTGGCSPSLPNQHQHQHQHHHQNFSIISASCCNNNKNHDEQKHSINSTKVSHDELISSLCDGSSALKEETFNAEQQKRGKADTNTGTNKMSSQEQQRIDTTLLLQSSKQQLELEFPDYKQLVGPDQAYPAGQRQKRWPACSQVLIENHNYASVLRASSANISTTNINNARNEQISLADSSPSPCFDGKASEENSIVLVRDDDYSPVYYANLPHIAHRNSNDHDDSKKIIMFNNNNNNNNDAANCPPVEENFSSSREKNVNSRREQFDFSTSSIFNIVSAESSTARKARRSGEEEETGVNSMPPASQPNFRGAPTMLMRTMPEYAQVKVKVKQQQQQQVIESSLVNRIDIGKNINFSTTSIASLSGHSCSSSSADSGGFSALKPAKLQSIQSQNPTTGANEIFSTCSKENDNNFSKTTTTTPITATTRGGSSLFCESSSSAFMLNDDDFSQNRKSLLKRFGSLVSRAFSAASSNSTSTSTSTSVPSGGTTNLNGINNCSPTTTTSVCAKLSRGQPAPPPSAQFDCNESSKNDGTSNINNNDDNNNKMKINAREGIQMPIILSAHLGPSSLKSKNEKISIESDYYGKSTFKAKHDDEISSSCLLSGVEFLTEDKRRKQRVIKELNSRNSNSLLAFSSMDSPLALQSKMIADNCSIVSKSKKIVSSRNPCYSAEFLIEKRNSFKLNERDCFEIYSKKSNCFLVSDGNENEIKDENEDGIEIGKKLEDLLPLKAKVHEPDLIILPNKSSRLNTSRVKGKKFNNLEADLILSAAPPNQQQQHHRTNGRLHNSPMKQCDINNYDKSRRQRLIDDAINKRSLSRVLALKEQKTSCLARKEMIRNDDGRKLKSKAISSLSSSCSSCSSLGGAFFSASSSTMSLSLSTSKSLSTSLSSLTSGHEKKHHHGRHHHHHRHHRHHDNHQHRRHRRHHHHHHHHHHHRHSRRQHGQSIRSHRRGQSDSLSEELESIVSKSSSIYNNNTNSKQAATTPSKNVNKNDKKVDNSGLERERQTSKKPSNSGKLLPCSPPSAAAAATTTSVLNQRIIDIDCVLEDKSEKKKNQWASKEKESNSLKSISTSASNSSKNHRSLMRLFTSTTNTQQKSSIYSATNFKYVENNKNNLNRVNPLSDEINQKNKIKTIPLESRVSNDDEELKGNPQGGEKFHSTEVMSVAATEPSDKEQPISGFWKFSASLMNYGHANCSTSKKVNTFEASRLNEGENNNNNNDDDVSVVVKKEHRKGGKFLDKNRDIVSLNNIEDDHDDCKSKQVKKNQRIKNSILLGKQQVEDEIKEAEIEEAKEGAEENGEQVDKYHSLNLYKNLLRNYTKKRHHVGRKNHGHHHSYNELEKSNCNRHYNHNHHEQHNCRLEKHCKSLGQWSRHSQKHCADCFSNLNDCKSGSNYLNATPTSSIISSSSIEITNKNKQTNNNNNNDHNNPSVWGQLIKINKADGSQVIELERFPEKSWGFFVARGAMNDTKGIFISRMHGSVSQCNPLTGLLGIGDRILAIDDCPIEQDYDILRVNQMISKKTKIILKVKPFKG